MVVHHVQDALHAPFVDFVREVLKVLHGAQGRIHLPVVLYGIRAPVPALPVQDARGLYGHEPDDVRAQGLDAVQVLLHRRECPLGRMVPDEQGIHHFLSQFNIGICCHLVLHLYLFFIKKIP